jgi:hypothetical protein
MKRAGFLQMPEVHRIKPIRGRWNDLNITGIDKGPVSQNDQQINEISWTDPTSSPPKDKDIKTRRH